MYHMDVMQLIQNALQNISSRGMIAAHEVQDVLLDIWLALNATADATPTWEPIKKTTEKRGG